MGADIWHDIWNFLPFGIKDTVDDIDATLPAGTNVIDGIGDAVVSFGDWCSDNPGECLLATSDWIPIAGTLSRCGQLAAQGVQGDVGQDTAFNCELNFASDALPGAAKLASRGFKAARLAARGSIASRRLATAERVLQREGLTQVERDTAFQELKTSRQAYSDLLTKEMEKQENLLATKEADAIAERSEWDLRVAAFREIEEHAAEIEARNNKIARLLKEGQLKHAAELEEEAALQLAAREADDLAAKVAEKDLAAAEKGVVANTKKAARSVKRAARTAGKKAMAGGAKVLAHNELRELLDLPVSMLNCRESDIEGMARALLVPMQDMPEAYKFLPMCHEEPEKKKKEEEEEPQISPGGQEDRQQPVLNPDLWGSRVEMETVPLLGSNVYLLLGAGVIVIVLGTVAYTRR